MFEQAFIHRLAPLRMLVPERYQVYPFFKDYLVRPASKELTSEQRWVCLGVSLVLGVLTLGMLHVALLIRRRRFRQHHMGGFLLRNGRWVRPAGNWKQFAGFGHVPDFSFDRPRIDLRGLEFQDEAERERVVADCRKQMRVAMHALDHSVVDALNAVIRSRRHPELLRTVNLLSVRILDLYSAYARAQVRRGIFPLPQHIGVLKSAGFTHLEILRYCVHCRWYIDLRDRYQLSQHVELLAHLSRRGYRWDRHQVVVRDSRTIRAARRLCRALAMRPLRRSALIELESRVVWGKHLHPGELENLKALLAGFSPKRDANSDSGAIDHRIELEIEQRFEWRSKEPGYLQNASLMRDIVAGNQDQDSVDDHFRTKLFFLYGSKGLVNEICADPALLEDVNHELVQLGRRWRLDSELAQVLRHQFPSQPVFYCGIYGLENLMGKQTRRWATVEELERQQQLDPNPTFAEAEAAARDLRGDGSALLRRFRMTLYPVEHQALFGHLVPNDELDRIKAQTRIPWISGKHVFRLHTVDECGSPWLNAVEALGLPRYSGISGSADQICTVAGLLGLGSRDELFSLGTIMVVWMGLHEDHTVDEVMTALKSFGIAYRPGLSYYRMFADRFPGFEQLLLTEQRRRGFELPCAYVSSQYAEEVLRREKHAKRETDSGESVVSTLMRQYRLALKCYRAYRYHYTPFDLFGRWKWRRNLSELLPANIARARKDAEREARQELLNERIAYELNPGNRELEPRSPDHWKRDQGTRKTSLTIVPPNGKVIPYVPFDWPAQNRMGLLFDLNRCQCDLDRHLFSADANVDIRRAWLRYYRPEEIDAPDFEEKRKLQSREASRFNRKKAHQVNEAELKSLFRSHGDQFIHYNELFGSINRDAAVGVFVFSKGLPVRSRVVPYQRQEEKLDWPPLHHESLTEFEPREGYDRYMRLMGAELVKVTEEVLGSRLPLFEINTSKNRGLQRVTESTIVSEIQKTLADDNGEQGSILGALGNQGAVGYWPNAMLKRRLQRDLRNLLTYWERRS